MMTSNSCHGQHAKEAVKCTVKKIRLCTISDKTGAYLGYYGDNHGNDVSSARRYQLLADVHAPHDKRPPGRLCVPARDHRTSLSSGLHLACSLVWFCRKRCVARGSKYL